MSANAFAQLPIEPGSITRTIPANIEGENGTPGYAPASMVIEAFTTARHYGVEDAVIASLHETFPGIDWEKQGAYLFQRVIEHGRRRSEEVREVAVTVQEAGLAPFSASGTAERQAWVADLADAGLFGERGSGAGQLDAPFAVALLPGGQSVLVVDGNNDRVSIWGQGCSA